MKVLKLNRITIDYQLQYPLISDSNFSQHLLQKDEFNLSLPVYNPENATEVEDIADKLAKAVGAVITAPEAFVIKLPPVTLPTELTAPPVRKVCTEYIFPEDRRPPTTLNNPLISTLPVALTVPPV